MFSDAYSIEGPVLKDILGNQLALFPAMSKCCERGWCELDSQNSVKEDDPGTNKQWARSLTFDFHQGKFNIYVLHYLL